MLDILKYPDPRLKEKSVPVEVFDLELHTLLDDMATAMYHANGIGLAAPQVGKLLRLFIIDLGLQEGYTQRLYEFINPKIKHGAGSISFEEGCLSVPGVAETVKRKADIVVEYQDRHGKPQTMTTDGLLAVAIQHENDHLDGTLFVDRLSPLKRRLVQKKYKKVVSL
jgi:peptide deformylase